MLADHDFRLAPPPSRAVSLGISVALVAIWGVIRLIVFDTSVFPLAYSIPLLVGVWTRDRVALWSMAAIFVVFHTLKIFWILEADALSPDEMWATYGATLANIAATAIAVHLIILLRGRLEDAFRQVQAQADELRAQGEELAQQNEELAEQTEELSQQAEALAQLGDELSNQNEKLQVQSEEIGALNEALERRQRLLQTLLETARVSGTERDALEHVASAARDMFGDNARSIIVYDRTPQGLRIRASVPEQPATEVLADDFVGLVLEQNRTASLNDTSLRPDLTIARLSGEAPFHAVLCAPIRLGEEIFGAFAAYASRAYDWTDEDFHLVEWMADQCARVLQTLQVQSELRQTNQRKSEFLATLSHELRNPLAAIGFALELAEEGHGDGAHQLRIIRRQFQQLVRLVEDLLHATRLSSNKIQLRPARIDLVAVVQQAIEAFRPDLDAAGHTLTVTQPSAPVWLEADPDRLAQVVTNFLTNATRFTPPGGRIDVSVSGPDGKAVLSVRDTGVGLERTDLERVFDMFTQVGGPGSGGLGIGLALVRGIVELHGGTVEALSNGPGTGSEFRVSLPVAARAVDQR